MAAGPAGAVDREGQVRRHDRRALHARCWPYCINTGALPVGRGP